MQQSLVLRSGGINVYVDPTTKHCSPTDVGLTTSPTSVIDRHTNATLQTVSDDSSTPLRKAIEFSLIKSPKTLVEHGKSMQQGNATVSGQIVRKEADGLPDLYLKPHLCLHLHWMYKTRGDMLSTNISIYVGILHKTKTFKHVLYQHL